ncbi:MAG: hypothetical protein JNK01_19740 [Devosia sp.]|nr:hypothetical protein [Devosia sp.]
MTDEEVDRVIAHHADREHIVAVVVHQAKDYPCATMRAALGALRLRRPYRLVLALPVAPAETIEQLRGEADHVECLETHMPFGAIGNFYSDFRQVSDDEVVAALKAAATPT